MIFWESPSIHFSNKIKQGYTCYITRFETKLTNYFYKKIPDFLEFTTNTKLSYTYAFELTNILYVDAFKITCILRKSLSRLAALDFWDVVFFFSTYT